MIVLESAICGEPSGPFAGIASVKIWRVDLPKINRVIEGIRGVGLFYD
jgi:hypothetical protein